MIRLHREVPDGEARKILNLAMFAAAGSANVTPDSLRFHVDKLEKAYLKAPKRRFRLVTSISANFDASPLRYKVGTSEIRFGWKPKNVEPARAAQVKHAEDSIHGQLPNGYSPVSAFVSARNANEAATIALDQIDLLRAIWNFWKNRVHTTRISAGKRSPVNNLILGPIHTLHTASGESATDSWWYEPSYLGPVSIWRDSSRLPKLIEFTAHIRSSLARLRYRDIIETSLTRYSRALDSRDWNYAVLQLWSIIELLTGTTFNENHNVTVKRVAFLFKDAAYTTQVLNHLREYRNSAVHSGKEAHNVEPLMYQAKYFVEALLNFHLSRPVQFGAMAEVAAFLDQPPGLAEVDRQIARLKAVRKFISN